ncbi:MAG TPA: C39 family peptidase [Chloroflexota bacterium]|nr:C39 family peptidase [Chloroflexota bacterium]
MYEDNPAGQGDAYADYGSAETAEMPTFTDTLPDGREIVIYGDAEGDSAFNHQQGDNPYGVQGDCGLVSCQDVLLQNGVSVTEAEVIEHAAENGECVIDPNDPEMSGGTSPESQAELLRDYGIDANAESGDTIDDLADNIQSGKQVIIGVNAGILWNDAQYYENGQANHAITVTAVVRDEQTGQILGVVVNDSGDGQTKFVDAATLQAAWCDTGGQCVVAG